MQVIFDVLSLYAVPFLALAWIGMKIGGGGGGGGKRTEMGIFVKRARGSASHTPAAFALELELEAAVGVLGYPENLAYGADLGRSVVIGSGSCSQLYDEASIAENVSCKEIVYNDRQYSTLRSRS
jgi:hypothetical protein